MEIVDAKNEPVTIALIRQAVQTLARLGRKPSKVTLHVAQECALENLAINVEFVTVPPLQEKEVKIPSRPPFRIAGIPCDEEIDVPLDVITFRDEYGTPLLAITNLGVPDAYKEYQQI